MKRDVSLVTFHVSRFTGCQPPEFLKTRKDVTAVNRFLISGADMNELVLTELGRRPIYINNPSVELLRHVTAEPVGPLYLLKPHVTPFETKR